MAHTIMHGMVQGKRSIGRPKSTWLTNIAYWAGKSMVKCLKEVTYRGKWRKTVYTQSALTAPGLWE